MNRFRLAAAGVALTAATAGLVGATPAQAAHLTPVQVLFEGNRIVTVAAGEPSVALSDAVVSGLNSGDQLVGIDRRPIGGSIYGVAANPAGANVYTIADGVATFAFAMVSTSGTPIVLNGSSFGVDFNPAADAIRITSDTGQNLRVLPTTRIVAAVERIAGTTFADGGLSYAPITDANRTAAAGIAGSAYTNSVVAPAGTTLLNLDTLLDTVTVQNPPNDGTQVTIGDLGRASTSAAGFDILTNGTTNTGYVVVTQEQGKSKVARLLTFDVTGSGAAATIGTVTELGALGKYRNPIGIAL